MRAPKTQTHRENLRWTDERRRRTLESRKKNDPSVPWQERYWTARGFSAEEARNRVSSIQKSNSLRRKNRVSCWTVSYWTTRGLSEEEARARVSEIQRKNSGRSSLSSSRVAEEFLKEVEKKFNIKVIREQEISPFIVDGLVEGERLVLEFFGDFWHCNPRYYSEDFVHPVVGRRAASIRREDEGRLSLLRQMGYTPVRVWESDWREDPQTVLEEIERARH